MTLLINRFNQWYDQLQEPKRFLLFISYITCTVLAINLGIGLENKLLLVVGVALLGAACVVAMFRAFDFKKNGCRWCSILGASVISLFAAIVLSLLAL